MCLKNAQKAKEENKSQQDVNLSSSYPRSPTIKGSRRNFMDFTHDESLISDKNQDVKVDDLFGIEKNRIQVVCKVESLFNSFRKQLTSTITQIKEDEINSQQAFMDNRIINNTSKSVQLQKGHIPLLSGQNQVIKS